MYPRIENVPFPGRTTPVAVVFKLAVPVGYERDLVGNENKKTYLEEKRREKEKNIAGVGIMLVFSLA